MYEADSSSSYVSSSTSSPHLLLDNKNNTKLNNTQIQQLPAEPASRVPKEILEEQESPEQSNKLSSTESPKTKHKKICGVCGDVAKSFHFGGLSCDSCKAFFRRSVHNDSHAAFRCAYDGHCVVDKTSRKGCQFCRFQKCLSIGMEKKWVMGEEERNQLKQKKEKKLENVVEKEFEPDVQDMLKYMTPQEKDEIECIVNKYQHSYKEIPYRVSQAQGSRNTIEIIQMFTTILRRFAYFTKLLPEFTELSIPDQSTLLRASVLEMCLLRGALSFDMKNNRWPNTERMSFLKDCPQLRVEDMEKLVSKDLYDMHMQFINGMQELGADEPTVTILLLVVLFYPERGTLENQHYISQVQEKYLLLLRKYVEWRYGPKGTKTFPKLLIKLADLRQLNDSHTEYNLKMTKNEVEKIQEQLGNLNLNPYPQWVLVEDQLKARQQQQEQQQYQNINTQAQAQVLPQQMQQQVLQEPQQMMQQAQQPQPQARDFFMQFVNRKIPALINNPFTQFPIENEIAYARSFFQQQQQQPTPENVEMETTAMSMRQDDSFSQFKNILESSDPDALRQMKESLSPTVLAKIQSVFGGNGQGFDISRIPPELINNYMSQNQNMTMPQQQQPQSIPQGYSQGMVGGGGGGNPSGGFQFQESHHHPMAGFTQSQLQDHFSNLQQQFRNPNYYFENQEIGYTIQPNNDYMQQNYNYHQHPPQLNYQHPHTW